MGQAVQLLWACTCNFPIRESACFLFSLVSVTLRILCYYNNPPQSPLFWLPDVQSMPLPINSQNQSLRQLSEKPKCQMQVPFSPALPRMKLGTFSQWQLASICSIAGLLEGSPPPLLSAAPRHPNYAGSLSTPSQAWNVRHMLHSSLLPTPTLHLPPTQRKAPRWALSCADLGEG